MTSSAVTSSAMDARYSRLPAAVLTAAARSVYTTVRMRRQWELRRGNFALSQGDREGSVKADRPAAHKRNGAAGDAAAFTTDRYCGEPTQTATSGVFAALVSGPQEAPLSPRNCAGLRVAPQ